MTEHEHADLDLLADLVAGEASPETAQAVGACATCSAALAELRAALVPVSAALTALPVPEVPDDVVARLDAALAAERTAPAPAPAPVADVVPFAPRRRSWAGPAAGIAAVAVLVLGGVVLASGSGGSSDDTGSAASTEAGAAGIATSSTGTDYTKDPASFTAALPGLLAGGAEAKTSTLAAPSGLAPADARTQTTGTADPLARLRDPQELAGCLTSLSDPGDDTLPLALDFATFEGAPAVVVLLPTSKAGKVDVYVVGARCAQADADLLFFTRVSSPS